MTALAVGRDLGLVVGTWRSSSGRGGGCRRDVFDDLRVRGRRECEHRSVDRPVGDFRRRQFDHRRRARRGVDRRAQRHAVGGVEGQLGAADQAAAFLGRDAHGVGGLAADVRRRGSGEVRVLARASRSLLRSSRRRGCGGGSLCVFAPGGGARGRRVAVEGVRRRRRWRRVAVVDDLRVAFFGLQLEADRPSFAIHRRPDAPVMSGFEASSPP